MENDTLITNEAKGAATWLAGRWAAKEAARKAWGAAILSWKDVRVELDTGLSPPGTSKPVRIVCQPYHTQDSPDFDESEHQLNLRQEGRLSVSHDGDYCVATVIAEPLNEELLSVFQNRTAIVNKMKESGWTGRKGYHDAVQDEAANHETSGNKVD